MYIKIGRGKNGHLGFKHSEETKRKMSLAQKGTKKPWVKGPMLGHKHSEETKKRISEKKKGIIPYKITDEIRKNISKSKSGDKHPNWKGGISKIDKNKYRRDWYNNLNQKHKNKIIWGRNKRNRVIKRLKIESLSHTFGEWELLKKQYGYTCPSCKKSEPEIKLTEDHIIPLSKGGSDLIENIQPLCFSCNAKKHLEIIKY